MNGKQALCCRIINEYSMNAKLALCCRMIN